MIRIHRSHRKGFTVLELTLATAFISILLIVIAYLIINIVSVYQKGLAIKSINSTGRQIVDDLNRTIIASSAKDVSWSCGVLNSSAQSGCNSDNGFLLTYHQHYQTGIKIDGEDLKARQDGRSGAVPTYGAFCTGRYSYLWNTGYTFSDRYTSDAGIAQATLRWQNTGNDADDLVTGFRLLRFLDYGGVLCSEHIEDTAYQVKHDTEYDITSLGLTSAPIDLLADSDDNLAIYDFSIFRPVTHDLTFQSFYSGTFILATIPGGVDITGSGNYCKDVPDGLSTDFAYCAINKFNFAARARGELTTDEATRQKL